jgi:hypothetical protein
LRFLEAFFALSRARHRLVLLLTAMLIATALVACSADDDAAGPPAVDASEAEALAAEFLTLLQKKDTAGLQTFLADSFTLQRADGSWATKENYLTNLPNLGEFSIGNLTHRQTDSALVVRWDLTIVETINGQQYRGTPAPRLSTFVYVEDRWQMMSHANFNAPAAPPPASSTN